MRKYKLNTKCSFEDIWKDVRESPESRTKESYPAKEICFMRCDFPGYRWYTNTMAINSHLMTPAIQKEYSDLVADILESAPISNGPRSAIHFCSEHPDAAMPANGNMAYNFYHTGKVGNYWVQIQTNGKDCVIYIHAYTK